MEPGLRLAGRYRLVKRLGYGGTAEIWEGVDLRLRRSVAVKFLHERHLADPVAIARFRREAQVTARLQHPGVTVTFDIDDYRQRVFLVMELLRGRDLCQLLAEHPHGLPIDQVVTLATQISDTLAAAHAAGIVHRDIKPANLFLLDDGRVKVCDFGMACLADATSITESGACIGGTPLYMAPEQIRGDPTDSRTDLYALGCVLYALVTGVPPFDAGTNAAAIMYQHLQESPPPPQAVRSDCPDWLNGLIAALMAKDPGERPATAAAVAEQIRSSNTHRHDRYEPRHRAQSRSPFAVLTSGVTCVAFSRDGHTLASGGFDAQVRLWDVRNGQNVMTLTGHTKGISFLAFCPDGRTLVSAGAGDDRTIRLWNIDTGENTATLTGDATGITCVAISRDGRSLACGGLDARIRLWDVRTGRNTKTFSGHSKAVTCMAFNRDGRALASVGAGDDPTIRLWDTRTGDNTATLTGDTSGIRCMAISPDGRTIAASGGDDRAIRLCSLDRWRRIATAKGHTGEVLALEFSPDGRLLASGGRDTTVRLWQLCAEHPAEIFTGHTHNVYSIAFSPDGQTLASGGRDGALWLWRVGSAPLPPDARRC
ncbi:serine/threonine protein kinase [Actinomadura barringtoniae]|uniref:non-specific serine/threonine protein kinase n=1 Tax=Actinomadura barringtoniae TaxID=1427535 RepID=A0A939PLN4_9ACTN|nr:serine/threonine-protein kinase [Actinomadura barringtoniae]MBO2450841.1 serine/threonine protein kinase [Actinomadura barringtoniae]